jgi:hypothetical protein
MPVQQSKLALFTNRVAARNQGKIASAFTTADCNAIQAEAATLFSVPSADIRVFIFNSQDSTATVGYWKTSATSTNAAATTQELTTIRNELNGASVHYPGASVLAMIATRISGTTGLFNLYASSRILDASENVVAILKIAYQPSV